MPKRFTTPLIAVLASAAVAGAVGAYASIPGKDGTISGCYKPGAGKLRVIDPEDGQTCKTSERALAWNQTGPQGIPGAQGAPGVQGAPGAQGPQGAQGLSGPGAATAVVLGNGSLDWHSAGFSVTHTAGSSTYRVAWAAGTVAAFAFPEILSSAGGRPSFGEIGTSGDGSGWMIYTPGCECDHIVYLVPFLDDANPGAGPSATAGRTASSSLTLGRG